MKKLILLFPILTLLSFTTRTKPWFMPQPEGFVYIPTGTVQIDGKQITKSAFWMSSSEVTNKEYREFLVRQIDEDKFMPNKEVIENQIWISKYSSYFTEPLFDDFPVVGLTETQMLAYANWLGQKMRNEFPKGIFNFRLPTKHEWQYAAMGGSDSKDYPWAQSFTRNSKGCVLMHYFDIDQRFAVYGEEAPDKSIFAIDMPDPLAAAEYSKILQATKNLKKTKRRHFGESLPLIGLPVPADSYWPNGYGLYNMSGNVAELTADKQAIGGSFKTTSEYCKITGATAYPFDANKPQADVGFRLVCDYEGVSYDKNGNLTEIEDTK